MLDYSRTSRCFMNYTKAINRTPAIIAPHHPVEGPAAPDDPGLAKNSVSPAPGPEVVRYRPTDEGTTNDVPDVLSIFKAMVPSNARPGGAGDDHGISEIRVDEAYRSVMAAYR